MVTSTLPPPRKPNGPTPLELAHSLITKPRFAFFKDERGVLYCEEVDHRKLVVAAVGKTMGGAATLYRSVVQYAGNDTFFNAEVRDVYDRGFLIEPDMAYMNPNIWGVMKVIRDVEDMKLGRKFRYLCRAATPEGIAGLDSNLWVDPAHIKKHARPIQPFTAIASRRLAGESLARADVMDAFASEVTDEEFAYFPKWVVNG